MPFYDSEAIERARQVDLLTYLQTCEPQELVHVSGNVYCTKTHDSLRISNGKWCWFSRGIGGYSALDYLIKVNGYSFLEAMETISGRAAIPPPSFVPAPKEEKPKHLLLPQAAPDNRAMMAYLKGRGIDQEILDYCVRPDGFMRAGTRATATWFSLVSTRMARRGSAACGESVKPGSTGI